MISALLEFMALCVSVTVISCWSHHTDASLTHPLEFVSYRLKKIISIFAMYLLLFCYEFESFHLHDC